MIQCDHKRITIINNSISCFLYCNLLQSCNQLSGDKETEHSEHHSSHGCHSEHEWLISNNTVPCRLEASVSNRGPRRSA